MIRHKTQRTIQGRYYIAEETSGYPGADGNTFQDFFHLSKRPKWGIGLVFPEIEICKLEHIAELREMLDTIEKALKERK